LEIVRFHIINDNTGKMKKMVLLYGLILNYDYFDFMMGYDWVSNE